MGKKIITIFNLFFVFYLNAQYKNNLSISIKDKNIIENQKVNFEIKNNSYVNYYILIDTLFLADALYDNEYFSNPYFVLSDKKKNEALKISEIIERGDGDDFKNFKKSQNNLIILEIKSKKSLNFKIPFKIKRDINNKISTSFFINRKESYYAEIKYKLTEQFVSMKYIKNRIDSLKLKKYDLYLGTITSNKVPVILENK